MVHQTVKSLYKFIMQINSGKPGIKFILEIIKMFITVVNLNIQGAIY